ncbi:plasmid maintenance system antidote protein VapI [Desulfohalotomaculum tongense]|uniref:hypothetical protein n=1 Tax=Desulforadius tongensis TaxID=1216062 RepID=UPI0019562767|nr:hypothetical protein [Desulforadius tongensis]MBM7855837.1 plasmid maintenance system antidote protein VapI [Desulforadius tongensis]
MKSRKGLLTLVVVMLGIAFVGVANADTVKAGRYAPAQTSAAVQTGVTPEQVQQMIQACWQLDQAMVDRWTKVTGLSKDDLLNMEQAWMQGVMQLNPNLNTKDAFEMHRSWMQNYMAKYQLTKQVQQNDSVPSTPPVQVPQYGRYYGWPCWNGGYGYCW